MRELDNSFGKAINWSSLVIILVSLASLIWIITYLTLHEVKPIKNEVLIETKISKNDTTTKLELDSYLKKVDQRITELQNVESSLNKKIEEVNSFYKFLGTILAIIIAITGFFGFKSLHELKIRNLENAKEVAKNEANSKVETELVNLKDKVNNAIELAKSEAKMETLSEFYESQTEIDILSGNIREINDRIDVINDLENNYEDLRIRIKFIEGKFTDNISDSVDDSNPKKSELEDKGGFEDEIFGEEGFENKK